MAAKAGGQQRQQVLVTSVQVLSKQVEGVVVEAEVPAHAIERLTRRQHRRKTPHAVLTLKALHRTSIEIERPQIEIGMIAGTAGARRLNFVAAGRITLQVKAVGKAGVNIFEVGV